MSEEYENDPNVTQVERDAALVFRVFGLNGSNKQVGQVTIDGSATYDDSINGPIADDFVDVEVADRSYRLFMVPEEHSDAVEEFLLKLGRIEQVESSTKVGRPPESAIYWTLPKAQQDQAYRETKVMYARRFGPPNGPWTNEQVELFNDLLESHARVMLRTNESAAERAKETVESDAPAHIPWDQDASDHPDYTDAPEAKPGTWEYDHDEEECNGCARHNHRQDQTDA